MSIRDEFNANNQIEFEGLFFIRSFLFINCMILGDYVIRLGVCELHDCTSEMSTTRCLQFSFHLIAQQFIIHWRRQCVNSKF